MLKKIYIKKTYKTGHEILNISPERKFKKTRTEQSDNVQKVNLLKILKHLSKK